MFVLSCHIEIEDLVFDQVVDLEITRSVDLLSDTAVIKLPTKFAIKDTGQTQDTENAIKVGQAVSIALSYKGATEHTEFKGFVTHVKPKVPVEVHCEDAIWKVRQKTYSNLFGDTSLKDILTYVKEGVEGADIEVSDNVPDIKLNSFLLKNDNGAQALQKLKNEYGVSIFLDDGGNLFAGLRQTEGAGKEVAYDMERDIVRSDLRFKKADEVKVKLIAKGWMPDNTYTKAEAGDPDGEQRVWETHNIRDKESLDKIAESKLKETKYDGYDGTLTSFLVPFADRGMTAVITDGRYPEREGRFFIPKVVIRFGTNGARRIVSLGRRVGK